MRQKVLKQKGIAVGGNMIVSTWNGDDVEVIMNLRYLPMDEVSKDNIIKACNDGGYGAASINNARIDIFIWYDAGKGRAPFLEYERCYRTDHPLHLQSMQRGIR